ncbi:probable RNA helicase armi [Drosophila miranda]|uniref:probable RNA helicase armi n=1 Tax=Drosophila miranda TaxID=7229 RepID=UPI0007E702DE|nr:probable RNA helicase armi [Drosophila miranda]
MTFVPKKGDWVTLKCAVQLDDGYVDKQGEILELLKVFPARILSNQKLEVDRCFPEFVDLGNYAYLLRETFPTGTDLHTGERPGGSHRMCLLEIHASRHQSDPASRKRRPIAPLGRSPSLAQTAL